MACGKESHEQHEIGAPEDAQHPEGCGCPACQPAVRPPEARKKKPKKSKHLVGCACDECQVKRQRVFLDLKSLRPSRRRRKTRSRPMGRSRRSRM